MSDDRKKSLIDFSDAELLEAYRGSIKNTQWTPTNYRKEMFWRSQERNTTAYNRWTSIIALATLINTYRNHRSVIKVAGMVMSLTVKPNSLNAGGDFPNAAAIPNKSQLT